MSRADLLDPATLEAFDKTWMPSWGLVCGGCGTTTLTLGERARHNDEAGRCPIEPLAGEYKYLDDVYFWRKIKGEDHIYVVRVHRLHLNGNPMMWFNGARHSDLCACLNESPVLDSESGTR